MNGTTTAMSTDPRPVVAGSLLSVTADIARELAIAQRVCVRPVLRRVIDQAGGGEEVVAIPCGSTHEAVCPPCADKARRLRIQQCAEGWHRTDEPERDHDDDQAEPDRLENPRTDDIPDSLDDHARPRRRSTRRRPEFPDLPRMPAEDRTIGRVFLTPDGREYRPSMFLTLTLPSYGAVQDGVPVNPASYDYRRAALDAMHFPKLLDRFWQNLRRCAGYHVQYFSAIEPQRRLAPHLHAAIRGAIPRIVLRQVVAATYEQLWWPAFDHPVYIDRIPAWTGTDYVDPDTGEVLPTWDQALDAIADDEPVHVLQFGRQIDMAGIIAPSPDADRSVRYLTKYLAKSITGTFADSDDTDPAYLAHIDRLHAELRWMPCSDHCANWLRYGIQPKNPGPGLGAGRCPSPAHDRENLGCGGRRVLVSRQWSGKTLREHKADRAAVVRETLMNAGMLPPEIERLAATVTLPDGRPRYVWTDTRPDPGDYISAILASVAERARWREQYDTAKQAVDTRSANDQPP